MEEYAREPWLVYSYKYFNATSHFMPSTLVLLCNFSPWRIVDDCGGAFTMGAIGGSIFQAIKGFRNSPAGINHRLTGSLTAIKSRKFQLKFNCSTTPLVGHC